MLPLLLATTGVGNRSLGRNTGNKEVQMRARNVGVAAGRRNSTHTAVKGGRGGGYTTTTKAAKSGKSSGQ